MYSKYNFPLPHVFGLRRLQSNPPRSLWLQHIHWMCCLTRRAHTVVPTRKGTHGDRSAWGHTDAIDFVAIASSLQATNGIRDVCNTNRLKAVPLRFVRQLRNNTAQSLVLSIKLGAPFSRRRCGSHPEYAHSVYKNALNKFSFIRLRQRRTSPSRQSCETAVRFLIRLILIAKIFCAVVIARTSAVNGNRHCVAFLFRGFPRRFTPRNDIWGGCHNRNAV